MDGLSAVGELLSTGTYFYQLQVDEYAETQKMVYWNRIVSDIIKYQYKTHPSIDWFWQKPKLYPHFDGIDCRAIMVQSYNNGIVHISRDYSLVSAVRNSE